MPGFRGRPGFPGLNGFPGMKGDKGFRGDDCGFCAPGWPGEKGDGGEPGKKSRYLRCQEHVRVMIARCSFAKLTSSDDHDLSFNFPGRAWTIKNTFVDPTHFK